MIGQSQSGTGKTAAFVLTMLSRIDFTKNKTQVCCIPSSLGSLMKRPLSIAQALCLAPSRELARQIMSVVVSMGKFTNVQTEYAIKEHLPRDQTTINAHVVVGTPGTMTDLLRRKVIDASEVKVFVLDEADNMLDRDGLGDQTLRVKKSVSTAFIKYDALKLFQPFAAKSATPNYFVLGHLFGLRPSFCIQVCPQRKQD